MRGLGLLVVTLALLTPIGAADHPGSNKGLAGLLGTLDAVGPEEQLVHRLPTLEAKMASWDAAFPDLIERATIGTTTSGAPLLNVRITDESVPFDDAPLSTHEKLRVYLDGGHHGNEFLGVELVVYWIDELLAKHAAGDEETMRFLAETEIYATPMVNVEGNTLDSRKNGRQVDLNRNYDFMWGDTSGASDNVADFTYHGPAPFSEPESRANADFQTQIRPDIVVTTHTGIAEFYWPWGWTHDPAPDDWMFTSLESPFENATNGRVDAMQGAELYIVTGASDDWAYAVLGAPGFTFEVHEDQFIPIYGEPINDLIRDQLAGLEFIVKNVKRIGAWVEPIRTETGWRLENQGWGNATNLTVTIDGQTTTLGELALGTSVDVLGGDEISVSYNVLYINTTKVRTHTASATFAAAITADAAAVPGLGMPALLVGVVVVGLALRRRA